MITTFYIDFEYPYIIMGHIEFLNYVPYFQIFCYVQFYCGYTWKKKVNRVDRLIHQLTWL